MSKERKKSAKDIAFDKERAKFRKQLREEEDQVCQLKREIAMLKKENDTQADMIRQKDDWIRRLLEYMDLPEDEIIPTLENAKKQKTAEEQIKILQTAIDTAVKNLTGVLFPHMA